MSATEKAEPNVTRFEVIDHRKDAPEQGRCFVATGVAVELSYQDGGRTLKIFVDDPVHPCRDCGVLTTQADRQCLRCWAITEL